ncbi:MAG: hypothetical protein IKG79_06260 [Neisseriaceae bacterium]|nr:hypothetical protein [Neisseriaceae bacterium]
MTASNALIKSRYRVQEHGEVFTPPFIVARMLDLVDAKVKNYQARFLEPACGDGNFLAAILEARLNLLDKKYRCHQPEWERQAFFAVSSLYGIELLQDNVERCRKRLFSVFRLHYEDRHPSFWKGDKYKKNNQLCEAIHFVLHCNIVQGHALDMCQTQGDGLPKCDKGGNPLPIIFSEWNSSYQQNKIIRKEWVYHDLVNNNQQQSFRQPETQSVSENQQNDLLTENNQQGDLFADLFAENDFRQPEKLNPLSTARGLPRRDESRLAMTVELGKVAQPTKVQNGEKQATPFSQTREFPPVNYWEISEEIYQKPRRHRYKGVKNA